MSAQHDEVSETDSETNVDNIPRIDLTEHIILLGLIVAFFVLGYALFVEP